jgi:signal transduction histidine kinase
MAMTKDGTSLAIAHFYTASHSPSAGFDLNEALRTLADSLQDECGAQNIAVIFDLAADLPKAAADGEQITNVLCALFSNAQRAILSSGKHGSITVCTQLNDGRMRLSLTHDGSNDGQDLTVCAGIVQDQAGELYLWRPRDLLHTTIIMDLPA